MSGKCAVIGGSILFLAITTFVSFIPLFFWDHDDFNNQHNATLTLIPDVADGIYSPVICKLYMMSGPLLWFFIQATSGDQDSRLNGLAVYLKLTNACQPLEDVSKAKIQLHKVALVTLENNDQTRCPFQKLAVKAQKRGYIVLIHFGDSSKGFPFPTQEEKLLIPVLNVNENECRHQGANEVPLRYLDLSASDLTNVEIRVPLYEQPSYELTTMQSYLEKLYYWFLVGPIITLEWLRRKKKFCWMSGGQQLNNNGQTDENEAEMRTMEEGGNRTEGSHLHSTIENYRDRDGEEQPLLTTQPTVINDYTRQPRDVRDLYGILRDIPPYDIKVGFYYLILVAVALPVGISCGGLSFFRFDDDMNGRGLYVPLLDTGVWPTLQIICFFMYSRFACKITWTIQTEFSKLIRSDWFASNIYLLVLGVVVPYCSFTNRVNVPFGQNFSYFVTYNTLYTVCNVLFVLILNKHKVVTRYVFYISICMICAYVESDIVAVFYFALNSQGSLANLKLTALRTVAIGLTLTISFNSSMHIVRKLVKPRESLFEGLGEK